MFGTKIEEGLGTLTMDAGEAARLLEAVQAKIRQICWATVDDRDRFRAISRLSKIAYQLACGDGEGSVVTDMSLQDVEDLYALPVKDGDEDLMDALNKLRPNVRKISLLSPVVADRMAKQLDEIPGPV